MSGTETSAAIAPDSTGKNIRLLTVTAMVNGVATDVQMQVVALANEQGLPVSFGKTEGLLEAILTQQLLQTEILWRLLCASDNVEMTREELEELVQDKLAKGERE